MQNYEKSSTLAYVHTNSGYNFVVAFRVWNELAKKLNAFLTKNAAFAC